MIQSLFHIMIVSVVCIFWGLPVILYELKKTDSKIITIIELIRSFFVGLCLLGVVTSVLTLFIPLKFWILSLTIFPVAILLYQIKKSQFAIDLKNYNWHWIELIFLFTSLFLFWVLGSSKPSMEDTELYHVQIIQLTNNYKAIPGIGNIYLRYGFSSNWFHLSSIFYFPLFSHQNYLPLNCSLSIWTILYLFFSFKLHIAKKRTEKFLAILAFFIMIYMLIEWNLLRGNAASTSYDFIVTVLTLICFFLLFENIFINKKRSTSLSFILIALAIPTFKLTGLSIFVFLIIYLVKEKTSLQYKMKIVGSFLAFIFPLCAKNYIQTGYIFFPFTSFSLPSVSWKIPELLVKNFASFISLSNKFIQFSPDNISPHSFDNYAWVINWFFSIPLLARFFCMLSLFGLLSGIILFYRLRKINPSLLQVFICCSIPILPWFLFAPDLRFAYGYLLLIAFTCPAYLISKLYKPIFFSIILIIVSAGTFFYTVNKIRSKTSLYNFILMPDAWQKPSYQKVSSNGITFTIPSIINNNWNQRCYDLPPPCIYQVNPFVKPLGKKWEEGFLMNEPTNQFIRKFNY